MLSIYSGNLIKPVVVSRIELWIYYLWILFRFSLQPDPPNVRYISTRPKYIESTITTTADGATLRYTN